MTNAQQLANELGLTEASLLHMANGVLDKLLRWNDGNAAAVVADLTGDRQLMLAAVESSQRDCITMAKQVHADKLGHARAVLDIIKARQ